MRTILASLVILTNLFSFNESFAGSNNATVFASAKILNSVSVITEIDENNRDAFAVATGPENYSIQVSINGRHKADGCNNNQCNAALNGKNIIQSITVDVE